MITPELLKKLLERAEKRSIDLGMGGQETFVGGSSMVVSRKIVIDIIEYASVEMDRVRYALDQALADLLGVEAERDRLKIAVDVMGDQLARSGEARRRAEALLSSLETFHNQMAIKKGKVEKAAQALIDVLDTPRGGARRALRAQELEELL